jgi:hypothetical protein
MPSLPQTEAPPSGLAANRKPTMKRPVFVIGSPRSGTTLLYHMLLSAGGFAVYRSESKIFDLLAPRFGNLRLFKHRKKMLDLWLQTKMFGVSGANPEEFQTKILGECNSAGDFLRIFMEGIASAQNVDRWAECTPEHVLYVPWIKRELPDAQFIHIIRDGRDVALSLEKQGWVKPFPWNHGRAVMVAGIFWEWIVGKGRGFGKTLGADYIEVRFEDLLSDPRATLLQLGRFIDHDLDYDRIQRFAIGSVSEPNTSFVTGNPESVFRPVGRWQDSFSRDELAAFESLVGPFLEQAGYPLAVSNDHSGKNLALRGMRTLYRSYWTSKLWVKLRTPLGRICMRTAPWEL